MPQNFAGDANEYPLTIQAPVDGDTANAASVATGLEQLADRTANLNARVPVGLSNATPADLGVASAGVGSGASRNDHVHNMPSAADVGAQPLNTDLTAIAALTSAADKVPYATGAGTWALADFTAAGRSVVGAANAGAQRTALGLGDAAVLSVGVIAGTVAAGDDARLTNDRTANAIRETSGPTLLTLGAVADGQFLKRVGATVVGAASGLGTLGTAGQVLRTNAAANDTEWVDPFAEAGVNFPVFSNDHASPIVSLVGIQSFGNATTGILNLNGNVDRLYAMPWPCPSTDSLAGIMWEVTTAHAGQVVNWAIYESDAAGYPTNRIGAVSGLSLTTPATYQSAWSSPVPVVRGRLYWIAWTTNSAATAQTRIRPVPTWSNLGFLFSSGNLNFGGGATPVTHLRATVTYAVPPATFPSAASAPPTQFPIVGVYA